MRRLIAVLLTVATLPLGAQVVVDAGMPAADVIAKLGAPAITRSAGDVTYLFYTNGCERTCGMNDVVVLEKGKVVDAVFRSAKRRYSGTSSSPRMIPAAEARKAKATIPPSDGPITIELKAAKPAAAPKPPRTS